MAARERPWGCSSLGKLPFAQSFGRKDVAPRPPAEPQAKAASKASPIPWQPTNCIPGDRISPVR